MDWNTILISTGTLGGIGAAAAALLAGASRVLRVEEDPRIEQVTEALPGANCGGCGFPGCAGFAEAVVAGKADPTLCAPGGAAIAQTIGDILGITVEAKQRQVARLRCQGSKDRAVVRVTYEGMTSCKAVSLLVPLGTKQCAKACEGLGDCVAVCVFDAIRMGDDGLPVVDEQACTGCGKCVTECPKSVLILHPYDEKLSVGCGNQVAPKLVRKVCEVGCLHCRVCVRTCPYDALQWEGNLPKRIDGKCKMCGLCVEACKTQVLHFASGFEVDPQAKEQAKRLLAERKAAEAAKKAAQRTKPKETKDPASAPVGGEPS